MEMMTKLGSVAQEKLADALTREAHRLAEMHGRGAGSSFLREVAHHPLISQVTGRQMQTMGGRMSPSERVPGEFLSRPENRSPRATLAIREALRESQIADRLSRREPGSFASSREVALAKQLRDTPGYSVPLPQLYRAISAASDHHER